VHDISEFYAEQFNEEAVRTESCLWST